MGNIVKSVGFGKAQIEKLAKSAEFSARSAIEALYQHLITVLLATPLIAEAPTFFGLGDWSQGARLPKLREVSQVAKRYAVFYLANTEMTDVAVLDDVGLAFNS